MQDIAYIRATMSVTAETVPMAMPTACPLDSPESSSGREDAKAPAVAALEELVVAADVVDVLTTEEVFVAVEVAEEVLVVDVDGTTVSVVCTPGAAPYRPEHKLYATAAAFSVISTPSQLGPFTHFKASSPSEYSGCELE